MLQKIDGQGQGTIGVDGMGKSASTINFQSLGPKPAPAPAPPQASPAPPSAANTGPTAKP